MADKGLDIVDKYNLEVVQVSRAGAAYRRWSVHT